MCGKGSNSTRKCQQFAPHSCLRHLAT